MRERTTITRKSFFALLVSLLLVAGCSDDGADRAGGERSGAAAPSQEELAADQTLTFNMFGQPPKLDPAQWAGAFGPNAVVRLHSDALLKIAPDAKDTTAGAARTFDVSPDGRVYTFRLREDAKYNDGQPVRAADFVYAWQRLIDPRTAAPQRRAYASVIRGGDKALSLTAESDAATIQSALNDLGLRAVNDFTFEATLAQPAPVFKWLATLPAGAPVRRDIIEAHGQDKWAGNPATLVTNGPFKVSEMSPGQSVTLVRNPHHPDRPVLDKIVGVQLGDNAAAWARYLNGEISISNGPPSGRKAALEGDLGQQAQRVLGATVSALQFNTAKPPFDNPKVRLAFAQAIDRDRSPTVVNLEPSAGKPLTGLIPRGVPGHEENRTSPQRFDPAQAKATLAASGVDRARLDGMRMYTFPFNRPVAEFLRDQVQTNLGVTLTIEPRPDVFTLVQEGNYQIMALGFYQTPFPDPAPILESFVTGSFQNASKWSNAEYDRLVREAAVTPDADRRLQLYRRAEAILLEEAPIAVLEQVEYIFWIQPWVRGVVKNPYSDANFLGDVDPTKIWIAKH